MFINELGLPLISTGAWFFILWMHITYVEEKSLIALICSIAAYIVPFAGLVLSIIAVVFASKQRKKDSEDTAALVALILGWIHIALTILAIIVVILLLVGAFSLAFLSY